jgi:hypothetical protein
MHQVYRPSCQEGLLIYNVVSGVPEKTGQAEQVADAVGLRIVDSTLTGRLIAFQPRQPAP